MKYLVSLLFGLTVAGLIWWQIDYFKRTTKNARIERKILRQDLNRILENKSLKPGQPVFIRIFKQSSELELWMQKSDKFVHVKTYPICKWSGKLGPKLKQGDKQSPEGFYTVSKSQLNPNSKYHLSFNLGYPNRFDRSHKRSGDFLMVHGSCVSIGCYAITNAGISEVYRLAASALASGQSKFAVHIFPFRMNQDTLNKYKSHKWHSFWQSLKPAYDWFEEHKTIPKVRVKNKAYVISG